MNLPPDEHGEPPAGMHISRLIDARHKFTALIKASLYEGGSKHEGRASLIARNALDDFIFKTTPSDLVTGSVNDIAPLKRAIILETFAELLDILSASHKTYGHTGKG